MHDLLLRGGTVLDGTGSPGRPADVAVRAGRIVLPDGSGEPAQRVLDVPGAVVCPGFVDLHSHADFTVFGAPEAVTQVTQGVTTLVTGNCGFSPFPVVPEHADELRAHGGFIDDGLPWEWSTAGEYAVAVEGLPLGVNLALQVGHSALRIAAIGLEDRASTDEDLDEMRRHLRQAAADGVVGLSSGLIYPPGAFADTDELAVLVIEAAADGLLYSTHMRNEGEHLLDAVGEALAVARSSGVRLEISHLKAAGAASWGSVAGALDAIEDARRHGVDVSADQYPYTASSTTLTAWVPGWAMDGGTPALVDRLDDPRTAERIATDIAASARSFHADRIVLADTPDGPYLRFVGRSVESVAAELGLDPAHAVVELLRGQRAELGIVNHAMSEDDVRLVMRHPSVAVASDGHVLGCPGSGRPHPRSLGTFTRVLGHYVRDEGVLDLAEAVRKMTSLPASRLGWTDRGVVRSGAVADLVVLDPAEVADRATYADPWQLATGVRHTLVGGVPVLEDGEPTGAAAGRVLRRVHT